MKDATELRRASPSVRERLAGRNFAAVGIGASAGGLKPLSQLLTALGTTFSLPVLIVQHLLPTHRSLLPELLARTTHFPVRVATEGARFEAGCIFVGPADEHLSIGADGRILLDRSARVHYSRPSIDVMLESLAARFGENAIGVLLSGSGHDGTLGLTAMHEMGGLTIAQSPASAEFSSMPASAIDAGIVDMVLEPDQIGTMLGTLGAGMAHVDE